MNIIVINKIIKNLIEHMETNVNFNARAVITQ